MKITISTVFAGLTLIASISNAATLTISDKGPFRIYQARTFFSDTINNEVLELSAVDGSVCTVTIDAVKKAGFEVSSLITLLTSSTSVSVRCFPETKLMPADFGIMAYFK
ncbi:hypothetical protein CIK05_09655 [Bdellovibrio sp. qaytius]|nr:hypothetical protein CIK05_09655 [Bdellovibrio sp. qaytius]